MDHLVEALRSNGSSVEKPKGSFFLYVKSPKSAEINGEICDFKTGEDFSQWLITNELISTVPWDNCGHFVRFSVTFLAPSESEETSIIEEINRRLSQYKFKF